MNSRIQTELGPSQETIRDLFRQLTEQGFSKKLWAKDPSLWTQDPEVQKQIQNRLGWLSVLRPMKQARAEIMDLVQSVREQGFRHVLLLGMGGSSLCAEVFRNTYGVAEGYPDLQILDSTDPAAILETERRMDLGRTLFILSSKSGTTIEALSLYQYFWKQMEQAGIERQGERCVAITDAGTPLEQLARARGFRRIFLNPPDIGGRFSALSCFGLVPAALIGLDLEAIMEKVQEEIRCAAISVPPDQNPGIILGAVLAGLWKNGRDKVTFVADPSLAHFGPWMEQLLAESTGKDGKGLVPVTGEGVAEPESYGGDRVFVCLQMEGFGDPDPGIRRLQEAGHPVIRIPLKDKMDLIGQFFIWEVATAVAGSIMEVNPFDEPDVARSKENTHKFLNYFRKTGALPVRGPCAEEEGIALYTGPGILDVGSLSEVIRQCLQNIRPSDYVALMAYLQPTPELAEHLARIRGIIRGRFQVATTLGYGPRFLHSTGQLHKGGADHGLFLQITAEDREDIPVPGHPYTFGTLKQAQALGDFDALARRGLRVLRIHLGKDIPGHLARIQRAVS